MKRFFGLLFLPLLAGCIGEERERTLGNQLAQHINEHIPLVQDPAVTLYVQSIGTQIARSSARPDLQYRFYVVNSPEVNAFALPGGHVYLNRGLIERTEDYSQLAAVLGHEIGHVAARHGVQMLERQLRTGSLVSMLYRLTLGGEPGLLRESAIGVGDAVWSARHSRADELEADRLAVRYLLDAGVDPRGMTRFLSDLMRDEYAEDASELAAWFATHPITRERIDHSHRQIGKLAVPAPALTRDVKSYPVFLTRLRALPPPLLLPPGLP
ncbi:MAG: M48 family metallopeptidase [Gemmatimonadota bacterium]|nr:M48 family metallopeptidase [Gemmatimonadota bacterium]